DSTPRIVLFSDGRPTEGRIENAVARLAAAHIPVFVLPMTVRTLADTWIDRVDLPARIAAGGMFAATITVGAQHRASGTVTLRADNVVVATRDVTVQPGLTPVVLDGRIDSAGNHVVRGSI